MQNGIALNYDTVITFFLTFSFSNCSLREVLVYGKEKFRFQAAQTLSLNLGVYTVVCIPKWQRGKPTPAPQCLLVVSIKKLLLN